MKKILVLLGAMLLAVSCGIYSFSGTSIQPDVRSITINWFEYRALKVNPSLSTTMTEELRTKFRRMTKLEQWDMDGDLEITGAITGYDVSTSAVSAAEQAAQSRLTVTVNITFTSRKHPEEGFENKSFTAYSDYDSTLSLDSVESTLCKEIVDKLCEDIFNATVAQW